MAGVILRSLGRQATLVVYSGPTDLPTHSAKSQLYHQNLQTFLELGLSSPPPQDVTVTIVLTRKVAYLEPSLRARGAVVLYRRNVCYDMESARVALQAMRERWRAFTHFITLNCGLVGPMLPPYLIGSTTHWTELLTRAVRGQTKLVGMFVCCGGQANKIWPHIDSSLWVTDAVDGGGADPNSDPYPDPDPNPGDGRAGPRVDGRGRRLLPVQPDGGGGEL